MKLRHRTAKTQTDESARNVVVVADGQEVPDEIPTHIDSAGENATVPGNGHTRNEVLRLGAAAAGGYAVNALLEKGRRSNEDELRDVAAQYYQRGYGAGTAQSEQRYSDGFTDGEQSAQGVLAERVNQQRALDREAADNRVEWTMSLQRGNGINQAVEVRVAQLTVEFSNDKGDFRVVDPLVLLSAEAGDVDVANIQNTRLGFIERRGDQLLVRELDEPGMFVTTNQKGGGDLVNPATLYRGVIPGTTPDGGEPGKGTPAAFARYNGDPATEFMPAQLVAITPTAPGS